MALPLITSDIAPWASSRDRSVPAMRALMMGGHQKSDIGRNASPAIGHRRYGTAVVTVMPTEDGSTFVQAVSSH